MKSLWSLAVLSVVTVVAAKDKPWSESIPEWISAVGMEKGAPGDSETAIVLRDDEDAVMGANGIVRDTHRVVIRILDNPGTEWAKASVGYDGKSGRVRAAKVWLIRDGREVALKKNGEWLDISVVPDGTIFDESRAHVIDLSQDAVAGDVFAYECTVEEPALVSQFRYDWGWRIPAREQSFRCSVPSGFTISPVLHGAPEPELEKSADGLAWKWTLRNQPSHREEPLAPGLTAVAPVLLVQMEPPATLPFKSAVFKDWRQLAQWQIVLAEGVCDQSPRIVADAAHLTKGSPDTLSKIRTLAKTVQNIRYVEVNTNLGTGDGYKPRKASQVYERGYGDCKDKANLLRAMLREVGIKAYPVIAQTEEESQVWKDFPSPIQFNHVVVAIEVDPSIQLPACINVQGKNLLFFDPTNEFTQLGDLPQYLQGSNVEILSVDIDGFVTLPHLDPTKDFFVRRVADLELTPDAEIKGKASIAGEGQLGALQRVEFFHHGTPDEIKKHLTNLMSNRLKNSDFSESSRSDDAITDGCRETFTFSNRHFLQPISAGMALAHLDVFNAGAVHNLPSGERHFPIKLRPLVQVDEINLRLPVNYSADEIPPPMSVQSEYGSFKSQAELKDHQLVYTRRLEIKGQTIPAADYAKVRKFFADLARADRAALVLKTTAAVAQAQ